MYIDIPLMGTVDLPLTAFLLALNIFMTIFVVLLIYLMLKLMEEIKSLRSFRDDILIMLSKSNELRKQLRNTPSITEDTKRSDEAAKLVERLKDLRKTLASSKEKIKQSS